MNTFPPSRILVPVDLSEPSLCALHAAKSLAKRWNSYLDLVYIQDMPLSLAGFDANVGSYAVPYLLKQMEDFRQWREQRLRQEVSDFPQSKIHVRTPEGWPPKKLAELASGKTFDLIVMGTHGYAGMDRFLFGSVAEVVVRRAQVPVLTVHPHLRSLNPAKILVPYNMEPYADKALLYSLKVAQGFGAKASVLYVAPPESDMEEVKKQLREHLKSVLGKSNARRLESFIAQGDPREVILHEAVTRKFDLIVLSAHRRPFWKDWILGSTAERVLRHSPVPVLSIPSVGTRDKRTRTLQLSAGGVPTERIYVPG